MPDSGDNANDRLGGRKLEIFPQRSRNSNSLAKTEKTKRPIRI
jgi:hypothetical protein